MKNKVIMNDLSVAELNERLAEEKNQLVRLKLNHAVSQVENPSKIRAYRRSIARILTELRKREITEITKS